jgi:general secretion pathway protein F
MARFLVRVMPRIGVARKGIETMEIGAQGIEQAKAIAARRGTVVDARRVRGFDFAPGMSTADRYTFLVRLSTMLASKVGTAEALRLMVATFTGQIRASARSMLTRIESGDDLATAMELDRKNFPATLTAMVRAGASGGHTWKALREAADFEYELSQIKKTSSRGIWTAMGSFLIAAGLMISTTQWFGPWVMENPMFVGNNAIQVGWVETSGNILTVLLIFVLSLLAALAWMATIGRKISPDFFDGIIIKFPYYRELVLAQNNYVTLYKLGLLIRSGVRIEESLALTSESCPRGALRTDLMRAVGAVRSGRPWGQTMATLHSTDRAALSASTNREDVARTLDVLAVQYRDIYVQRISTFSPALQLVSAVFMSLAGAVLFGLTILPMLQLSASIAAGN